MALPDEDVPLAVSQIRLQLIPYLQNILNRLLQFLSLQPASHYR